jgi:hypothetical protein
VTKSTTLFVVLIILASLTSCKPDTDTLFVYKVRYEVTTSSGSGEITYKENGVIKKDQMANRAVWTKEIQAESGERAYVRVDLKLNTAGDVNARCEIYVDGELRDSHSDTGKNPIVTAVEVLD